MAQQQQTVLRVKTNQPVQTGVSGNTSMSITGSTTGFTYSGTGIASDPYTGLYPNVQCYLEFEITGNGTFYFDLNFTDVSLGSNYISIYIKHADENFERRVLNSWYGTYDDYFKVKNGDIIKIKQNSSPIIQSSYSVYFSPDVTNVQVNVDTFENLDLYSDIPLKINKSFAEIQDIGKKNSDYSIGLTLPGSKKNNAFFENFFDVDQTSLYFNITKKVSCDVLINDQSYFTGFLRLNSINVQNSMVEYDVTLYSTVADLFGSIGNNLLRDLDFRDADYFCNHIFNQNNTLAWWRYETLKSNNIVPTNYFYPISHNGYNYFTTGNTALPDTTSVSGTSYYTTTKLGSWTGLTPAYNAGVQRGHINSPEDGVRSNQLKPALNVYSLFNLIFKNYGYKIKSDFMTTPWMKLLYTYQFYSDNSTKLSYTAPPLSTFGLSGVDLVVVRSTTSSTSVTIYVVKSNSGTPALCDTAITGTIYVIGLFSVVIGQNFTIPANTASYQINWTPGFNFWYVDSPVGVLNRQLNYLPSQTGTTVDIIDNEYLDFNQVIDQNIKQIDFISSIAKKFNLVFIPSKENPFEIIVEPFQFYIGSGEVYDWTDKLSWDKGFTVQPAQNFIDSELHLTDKEGQDAANDEFRKANNRIYGRNIVYNPTDFKSSEKKIETIFSPQLLRKWNPSSLTGVTNDVSFPLMINFSETSQEENGAINWQYKGVKSNPRLIYNLGNFSPFLDSYKEIFNITGVTTSYFRITTSDGLLPAGSMISPLISHTMPIGNPDQNKINNDSITIFFNGESKVDLFSQTTEIAGSGSTFNIYTNQNVYNLFYYNRVQNAFDKNTRSISGYFNLKISDIFNLEPKDIIKINDQYFTWNKISEFNLTNPELTKVELIQSNYKLSTYPERYFKYQYCSGDTTTYKFKTNFTGTTSIYQSFYYWSILYDYFVGVLGGAGVTGYTSSIPFTGNTYVPYSIREVSREDYIASGITYLQDPLRNYFLLQSEEGPNDTFYNELNPIWLINSGQTKLTLNLFTGCTDFNTTATSMGVKTNASFTGITYSSGITINVTDTGYIKYNTSSGTVYQYVSSTGNYDIPDCADCLSVTVGTPYTDLANFTVVDCGNTC